MRCWRAAPMLLALLIASCGGGSGGKDINPSGGADDGCDGTCAQQSLTIEDVQTVIAQGVKQAESMGLRVTIAVTDRVGNVLGVFMMNGASDSVKITACPGTPEQRIAECPPDGIRVGGLEGLTLPSETLPNVPGAALAAISKAGTGAYLSSQGNAFTTRTASQIVQANFNPGERGQAGGPLFGVQFSQLPCGDLVNLLPPTAMAGPRALPFGLSADPGGLPLFKASSSAAGKSGSVPVGGVGVEGFIPDNETTPVYTVDPNLMDVDTSPEEIIATAAAQGFAAPDNRRADRITVNGRSLRFVDQPNIAPVVADPFASLPGGTIAVPPFCDENIRAGTTIGTAQSGILSTSFAGRPAEVLVDAAGAVRYPPRAAASPGGFTADEVSSILANGLEVIARTRAQIRQPLGTSAQVTITVVGVDGEVLGQVRSPDAPVFGTDVSLQKARNAAVFSAPTAAAELMAAGTANGAPIGDYVVATRAFLGIPDLFTGTVAFTDRAIGNLARPFFPDGINGRPNGPLSKPPLEWSPFNTGIQLDLVTNGLTAVLFTVSALNAPPPKPTPPALPPSCSVKQVMPPFEVAIPQIPNGIQIFPGSVPAYRGGQLIGGVGISGDGIDQDDLIGFLSLSQASTDLGTINEAPREIRADQISVNGSHLRYVNCPVQPFLDSDAQGVCDGL